jgi:hypothetical protein
MHSTQRSQTNSPSASCLFSITCHQEVCSEVCEDTVPKTCNIRLSERANSNEMGTDILTQRFLAICTSRIVKYREEGNMERTTYCIAKGKQ